MSKYSRYTIKQLRQAERESFQRIAELMEKESEIREERATSGEEAVIQGFAKQLKEIRETIKNERAKAEVLSMYIDKALRLICEELEKKKSVH